MKKLKVGEYYPIEITVTIEPGKGKNWNDVWKPRPGKVKYQSWALMEKIHKAIDKDEVAILKLMEKLAKEGKKVDKKLNKW